MSQAADSTLAAKLLSFKADPKLRKGIEESAKKNDRSVSAEIRQAVREYLERQAA